MGKLIANTAKMPRAEWLELRKQGIGGSDAGAISGVSKYSSPVMVYMDKLGLYIPEKPERVQFAARMGNELEPIVRKLFVEKINEERAGQGKEPLKVMHRQAIFAHDEHDWMRTNLDGIISDPEKGKGVFEAKTAHYMLRDDWAEEDCPDLYFIQCQHNMAVMGYDFAYLAVLIGGNDYRHYYIPRDQEFIDSLILIEQNFWFNHILQRIPPGMSGHDAEKEMLREQYPISEHNEAHITQLPIACIEMVEQIDAYKQLTKEMQQEQAAVENELKAIMGTTEMAFAGGHRVKWKTASDGSRRLSIKLDADDERHKFYNARLKEYEKARKAIEKERILLEKDAAKARKAAEKARKELEKAAKDAEKAEKAALKAAQAENEKVGAIA